MRAAALIVVLVLAVPASAQHPWYRFEPSVDTGYAAIGGEWVYVDSGVIAAPPVDAPSKWWTVGKVIGSGAVLGATIYDGIESDRAIAAGAAVEANPFISDNGDGRVNWEVKIPLTIGSQVVSWYLFKKHGKLGRILALITDAGITILYGWLGSRAAAQRRSLR